MARYIDADALITDIQETICIKCDIYNGIKCKSCGIDDTLDFLETAATADVAPKTEVAREIFEELQHNMACNYDIFSLDVSSYEIKAEMFAKIKKKYTEGLNNQ